MMTPTPPKTFLHVERPVYIYENERMWIGRGFSKAGLLPTERGPFSTEDGSLSWKTMREACLALLLRDSAKTFGRNDGSKRLKRGWSYHENGGDDMDVGQEDDYECRRGGIMSEDEVKYCGFVPCTGAEDGPTDEEGWSYYADFSPQSLWTPTRNRGMLDFVRRRKLCRVAFFRPDHFLPKEIYKKCDFCDSKAVRLLSHAMLDALSLATLFLAGTSNSDCTHAKVLPLKAKLIDYLSIGNNCKHDVLLYNQNSHYNTMSDVYKIKDKLSTFAESTVGGPGALTHLIHPDVGESMVKAMPGRKELIAGNYFSEEERIVLAKMLVKDVDRYAFQLHCQNECCAQGNMGTESYRATSNCEFRRVTCPNNNCTESFSFKYQRYHDEECGFKLLPCTSGCGMEVPRNEMDHHIREKCVLRAAECPLACLGCTSVVQAQDVSRHLNQSADQHFMFVANRIMECQAIIKKLNGRIQILEERNAQLELEIQGRTAQVSSKKDTENLSNELKKLTKRISTLEGTCRTEFKKIDNERKNTRK